MKRSPLSVSGSNMLKRWQQLAEPSLTSCLQSIPGVYTRAEILRDVEEESEDGSITPENKPETSLYCSLERLSSSVEKCSPETPAYPP